MTDLIKNLPQVRGAYRQNVELKTWFDVGGKAEILFKPADLEDLQFFLQNISQEIPLNILGAASNVIIKDEGVKGVVIRSGGEFAKISKSGENIITAGAAALCANVALFSKNVGLSGLEFLTGIPGSIGGALAMNAGCYGSDISKVLYSAKALDYKGNLFELKNADFGFFYRGNKIAKNFIFVEASFKLEKSSIAEVDKKITEFNQNREKSQPIRAKTGGSTFKNPSPLDPTAKKAWQLIDEAGLRGATVGGAKISEKHCNFMINFSNAKAQDLINLGNLAKKKVKEQTGIDLEWEIKII